VLAPPPHARQLLPVARDDEEAVVDREAEPERDHDVEREHVDVEPGDGVDPAQREERAEDGEDADEERQERGDDAPEDEDREDEEDREPEPLRLLQVALHLLAKLREGRRRRPERDPRLILELVAQAVGDLLAVVLAEVFEEPEDVGRAPVAGDEVLAAEPGVVGRLDPRELALLAHRGHDAPDVAPDLRRRRLRVVADQHDERHRERVPRLRESVLGLDVLRSGRVEAAHILQVPDGGRADDDGEDEEEQQRDKDPLRIAVGDVGEAGEDPALRRRRRRLGGRDGGQRLA
jgi:hypothetical protein